MTANVATTHVLAGFDRTLADAEVLLKEPPVIRSLTGAQIKRVAETYYAASLASDEEERREGIGSGPSFQLISAQHSAATKATSPTATSADPRKRHPLARKLSQPTIFKQKFDYLSLR